MEVSRLESAHRSRRAVVDARALWEGINPERIRALREETRSASLSPYVQSWLARYARVGQRGDFLWRWCYTNVKLVTLACVPAECVEHLADTKMIHLIFLCLIDDIVDERHDPQMFQAALAITQGHQDLTHFDSERRSYLELLGATWRELWTRMADYPRFDDFEDDLRFDYAQVLQGLWHSLRINLNPSRINVFENDSYQPHNMAMVYMAMLDLCASPAFDVRDLGAAREVFLHAQMMGRIGNTLATWERELRCRDFASGMFAHAVDLGVVPAELLRVSGEEDLKRSLSSPRVERALFQVWQVHRDKMAEKLARVRSVELSGYLSACEELVATHMCGRGLM
ncbi:MAG TPA: hypothetical protein VFX59_30840 [Polyangiales bacterium]|nr:hypothetical protein [Polyangiales bacterium]